MRWINPQRRQHRPHLLRVIPVQPCPPFAFQFFRTQKTDALFRKLRHEIRAPAFKLIIHHPFDAFPDGPQRFSGSAPVHGALHDIAFDLLLDAGNAHLKKLVQVGADDAEKLHPLQQRIAHIQSFLQHALVEFQPRELSGNKMCGGMLVHDVGLNLYARRPPPESLLK